MSRLALLPRPGLGLDATSARLVTGDANQIDSITSSKDWDKTKLLADLIEHVIPLGVFCVVAVSACPARAD